MYLYPERAHVPNQRAGQLFKLQLYNEDLQVVGSIPHAGVVLTTLVHPTMVGGPWTLLCHYSVHPRKGRGVLPQCPLVQWASGH